MHLDVIHGLKALAALERNWRALYAADPDAQFFVSFDWLRAWFEYCESPRVRWFVLAAKPAAEATDYVALFPLQLRTEMKEDGTFYNEIRMGGAEFADYCGLICDPRHEAEAIAAFADYLKRAHWTQLHLKNVYASARRLRLFRKPFVQSRFVVSDVERYLKHQRLDCSIYPYVALPGDFETYLNETVSANTRQKAKRFLKRLDQGKDISITHADAKTVARDIDILMGFWKSKWGAEKGEKLSGILQTNKVMLSSMHRAGLLFLPVLWQGEKPLGALGILIDREKKALRFLIAGRDETVTSPPPGFILHIYAIRWAIENGFCEYDFLQGNEPYKYMFGSKERRVAYVLIETRNKKNLGDKLDPRCLDYVVERAGELHKKGKLNEAECAYRQVLDTDPRHAHALYLLGQLMASRAKHAEAERCFAAFVAVRPKLHKGWLRLGKAREAQGNTEGARESYRKALDLDPGNRDLVRRLAELSPLSTQLRRVAVTASSPRN